ncbi:MAG: host attachment protein [Epsilonproteobacteria bacterium]|nr:host attachment protein [Campylobacterota bacterium]
MKVNDLVIVASLGEMKIYKANPRDLEAEAGLKPQNVKLDLINAFDYVESHMRLQDITTDEPGQFKGDANGMRSHGEPHNLEAKLEEDVIRTIADDINKIVRENNPPKVFLAISEHIFDRVYSKIDKDVQAKVFRTLKKDLTKRDKNELIEEFKKKF